LHYKHQKKVVEKSGERNVTEQKDVSTAGWIWRQ